jgi:hypothetical protein
MNNFYVLKPEEGIRFGTKWAYADKVEPINRGPCEECPVCGEVVSLKKWLLPHRIKLSSAKPEKLGDFLWGAGFLLVSSRFKDIYEDKGLNGIDYFSDPVEIVRIGKNKTGDFPSIPPKYHLINVPWGEANLDDAASGVILENPEKIKCKYCRIGPSAFRLSQIVIEAESWKGADILLPRGGIGDFIVSERFKQIAEKYQLKNLWLIPAANYGFDTQRQPLWYIHD